MTPMSAFGDVAAWLTDPDNWHGAAGIPARTWEHLVLAGVSLVGRLRAGPSRSRSGSGTSARGERSRST